MYVLAMSDRTIAAVRQLIASGEPIGQRDNAQSNAPSYALHARNHMAARRLLRLGARPDAAVGFDEMPAALIPVLARDLQGVKLLRRSGVDYSKRKFRVITTLDYAQQSGDRELIDALGTDRDKT
jgi:hypothetical protein